MLIESARPEGILLKCHFVRLLMALAALLVVFQVLPAQENAKPLTVEGIFSHGDALGTPPRGWPGRRMGSI